MLQHPQIDPVALHLGPLSVHWYGLTYLAAFALFYGLARLRLKHQPFASVTQPAPWTMRDVEDLLFWGVLGVILGGRLGYVLFYKPVWYASHPLEIFAIWQGGMSFHGGMLGVILAMMLWAWKKQRPWLQVTDLVAPCVPLGLAAGRMGNFINGELWGRVTDINAFWAMGFPQAHYEDMEAAAHNPLWAEWLQQYAMLPRHPSQLYQFALEGICLFIVLWIFSKKTRPDGQVASLFLAGYGFFRFLAEFARQPDDYLGLLTLGLSMGQWLSVPMIVLGAIGFVWFGKRGKAA